MSPPSFGCRSRDTDVLPSPSSGPPAEWTPLARRALERYGYEILEAEDGEAAQELMRSDAGLRVELAVLGVVMPRMDGRELGMRSRRERPGFSVLYISRYTGDELARRLLLDPSVPFLQKPSPPDEPVERLQELLELQARRPDD